MGISTFACSFSRVRYPFADPQVVFPTYPPRYPLVQAGRDTWRQDVRTLIVTEGGTERAIPSPQGDVPFETWWEYPDDTRTGLKVYKKGDMKLAASFRIANETFGDSFECVVTAWCAQLTPDASLLAAGSRMATTTPFSSWTRLRRWWRALMLISRTS